MEDEKKRLEELRLKQMVVLREKMERWALGSVELEEEQKKLAARCVEEEAQMKNSEEYLRHVVAEKEAQVAELEEALRRQEVDLQGEEEELVCHLSRRRKELEEPLEELRAQTTELEEKLARGQEILRQKHALVRSQETRLQARTREHEAAIASLEAETEDENGRVLKEKMEATKEHVQRKTAAILEEEKARHGQMFQLVQSLVAPNMKLLGDKELLKHQKVQTRRQMDKKETDDIKLVKKVSKLQEEVQRQERNLKLLHKVVKRSRRLVQSALDDEEEAALGLQEASSSKWNHLSECCCLVVALQREAIRLETLGKTMRKAAEVLRHTVRDAQNPKDSQAKLKKLLQVLDVPVTKERGSLLQESTSGPKPDRAKGTDSSTDRVFR